MVCVFQGFDVFKVYRYLSFAVSRNSMFNGFQVSGFLGFVVSRNQAFEVSEVLGIRIIRFHGFEVSWF
jgi:hypothetical protein